MKNWGWFWVGFVNVFLIILVVFGVALSKEGAHPRMEIFLIPDGGKEFPRRSYLYFSPSPPEWKCDHWEFTDPQGTFWEIPVSGPVEAIRRTFRFSDGAPLPPTAYVKFLPNSRIEIRDALEDLEELDNARPDGTNEPRLRSRPAIPSR